ncbi:MAG TPA: aconitase X catalytic domain-containing protein [Thermoleophilia bacterium]|nr:aconitase X catalytic domain-containing protein [Thermoleophilia bacterium]
MELTSLERDMLEGKHGEGVALAMKVQVGTGKAFYAKRMVPITRAHVAASAQEGDLYFVTKLVDLGARCLISPTTNPSMDLKYVEEHLCTFPEDAIARVKASDDAYRRIGATMTLSCTPEIEKNVPSFGEIVAFSESSASPYVNSVLGARTNRESSISALCAAVTGRVPEYGYLLDENRRGEILVEVEAKVDDDFDWALLGYAYPQKYKGPEVPVFTGIEARPTPEGFVQFGAELATSGAVAMYHVVGVTPEAPTVEAAFGEKPVKERVTITDADLDRVREQFSGEPGPIEYAMLGCPHLTIRQVGEIAALVEGKRFAVDTWILVSSLTLELAERMGHLGAIHRAGGHVIPDTCMDVPGCWDIYYGRPGVTESQKCAFYCQVYGQRYAVRPLAQAVQAALAGEVVK